MAVPLIYSGVFPDGIKNEPLQPPGIVTFTEGKVNNLVSQTCYILHQTGEEWNPHGGALEGRS
jgi:hypothetical protein